jgi:hypothetical protein
MINFDLSFDRAHCRASVTQCVKEHPIMKYMLAKIAHFLTDFHSHWFASLNLPLSDGKHNQLKDNDFDALYQLLQTIPGGRGEI